MKRSRSIRTVRFCIAETGKIERAFPVVECQLPVASFLFYNLDALLSSLLSVRVLPEIVRFGWHTNGSRQSSQTIQNRQWLGPEIDPQKAQRPTRLECAAGRELLHRVARRGKTDAFARRPHRFPGA